MRIDVITIFPEIFQGFLSQSILGSAVERGLVDIRLHPLRAFADGKRQNVDDYPFGGGAGMVMKPEPIVKAIEQLLGEGQSEGGARVVLTSAQGTPYKQETAKEFALASHLIFVAGRYKGIDERVIEGWITDEVSTGDYVFSGGEVPVMAIIDSVVRLLPGVVGNFESVESDSFHDIILGSPHYTRPAEFRGRAVPEVLLSGHHEEIRLWRRREALRRTLRRRPDLLEEARLSEEDQRLLAEIRAKDAAENNNRPA
ncbi:MAG: tRNA (guanosine(37)-N1)-methyltransferase TrmD [Candidatus Eisenbacteria sp.]|nr:tRNA (guanosine(37)-N1)-methyltransferase TrmD [Candidatus Eisenbacteria bacterium]